MLEDELRARKRHLEVLGDDSAFLSLWQETLAWLASADRTRFDELLHSCYGQRYRAIFAPCQRHYLTLLRCGRDLRRESRGPEGSGSLTYRGDRVVRRKRAGS